MIRDIVSEWTIILYTIMIIIIVIHLPMNTQSVHHNHSNHQLGNISNESSKIYSINLQRFNLYTIRLNFIGGILIRSIVTIITPISKIFSHLYHPINDLMSYSLEETSHWQIYWHPEKPIIFQELNSQHRCSMPLQYEHRTIANKSASSPRQHHKWSLRHSPFELPV